MKKSKKAKSPKKQEAEKAPLPEKIVEKDEFQEPEVDEWNDYPLYLNQFIGLLCGKTKLSDVVFVVKKDQESKEAVRYPAHKLILVASSPLFEAMLVPAFPEHAEQGSIAKPIEIEINNVDPTHFYSLLECVYSDNMKVDEANVVALVELGRKYQVEKLQFLCADVLSGDLTPENALSMFCMGSQLNDPEFGLEFIAENIEDIVATEGFLTLPRPQMKILLNSDTLEIDEINLFHALVKWGEHQLLGNKKEKKDEKQEVKKSEELKSLLGDLLYCIRFPSMSMEEVAGAVAPSGFLTEQQLLDIFKFKAMGESTHDESKLDFPTKPREGTSLCKDSQLIERKHKKDVMGFFGTEKVKFKLLYRGTRDGLSGTSFHSKCNNQGPTFTIIKATGRPNLFGGYTGSSWASSSNYLTSESWIYGLVPRVVKFVTSSPSNGAYDHPSYGPTWGGGHDLHVNTTMNSNSNYSSPNNYTQAAPGYTGTLTQETLAGAYNFTVQEIEVFAVTKKKSS